MSVSLRLLRVFLAVSREGNLGRTAAALYVSQPSLSQDIRRLEHELGTQLFVRGAHGVTLTPAGEAFGRDVEDALALLDRAVAEAKASGLERERRVVLGFTPSIGNRMMPSLIRVLERRVAGVLVDEREVDTGGVTQGVRSGAFDLGLAHCPEPEEGLETVTVRQERLSVALVSDHPLSLRGSPLRLEELADLPMMLWDRGLSPRYHDALIAICHESGLHPRIVAGPRRAMIRSYAVSDGSVFCLLPDSTSSLQIPGVSFIDVADEHAHVSLDMIRRERRDRDEIEAVWRVIIEEGGRL